MQVIKKYWAGVMIAILFAGAALIIYTKLHPKLLADNLVQGTGRIDGDLINLNVKYPGRIDRIVKESGDPVKKGEAVAYVKSDEYEAKKLQVDAQIEAKKEELAAKRIELDVARKTIPEALVKADANVAITQRQRDELEQMIHAQESVYRQSEEDEQRMKNLFDNRLIEKHQYEMAMLKRHTDGDQLSALKEKREQLAQAIGISKSTRSEAAASQSNVKAMERAVAALESGIKALEGSRKELAAVLNEMTVISPVDGYVVEKIANPGEVIGAGMSVATLIDPQSLYLKIFVDTLQNGKIKIGDAAVIFLDSDPDRAIEAKVVRIEQKAEFTPKEVSVPSDRIQRVFAVHLKSIRPEGVFKLGIPAVGVISLDGKGLPSSLREVPE